MIPSRRSVVPKPQTPEQVFAAAIFGVMLFLVTYEAYEAIARVRTHRLAAAAAPAAAGVGAGIGAGDEDGRDGGIEMDDCGLSSPMFWLILSTPNPSEDWSSNILFSHVPIPSEYFETMRSAFTLSKVPVSKTKSTSTGVNITDQGEDIAEGEAVGPQQALAVFPGSKSPVRRRTLKP
ncbi:hypothetical protein DL98DRAFT_628670 [Cadophora sp. DSE1049]|nr:hypothetical protein DL98DRAFT_628670 [Cadophora sp. DSE1049]